MRLTYVPLTHTVVDGSGFDWDIRGDGSVGDGQDDAFDGAFDWFGVVATNAATRTDIRQQFDLIPYYSAYYNRVYQRSVLVSEHGPWLRYLDTITNSSDQPVVFEYRLEFDFGQDGLTALSTSSGDPVLGAGDTWFSVHSTDPAASNTRSGVLFGDGSVAPGLSFAYDDVDIIYSVALAPGASASFLSFGVQGTDEAAVQATLQDLAQAGFDALDGLDGATQARIVNWALPDHALDITGTDADERLFGASMADTLQGLAGADTIFGQQDGDLILGGAGGDLLLGGAGDDTLYGDVKNDTITTVASATLADGSPLSVSLTLPDTGAGDTVPLSALLSRQAIVDGAPDIALAIDVSTSTLGGFSGGASPGDVNGDGLADTVLDAEIAAFEALVDTIANGAQLPDARITLIAFSSLAQVVFSGTASEDRNGNGVADAVEAARALQPGNGTSFEAAMQAAVGHFSAAPAGMRAFYFLSDGENLLGGPVTDEAAALNGLGVTTQSIGLGAGALEADLDLVDDGLDNDSATIVLDPAALTSDLLTPGISTSDIALIEVLANGAVAGTIAPADLVVTPIGLRLIDHAITGLNLWADDDVALRVTAADGAATVLSLSQTLEHQPDPDGRDFLRGGAGADSLSGGGGDDTLMGGTGGDILDGGDGFDVASYWDAGAGLRFDRLDSSRNTGEARGDSLRSIEELRGSQYDDLLLGLNTDDALSGRRGHDELHGRNGNDTLQGDDGFDLLYGGGGHDSLSGGIGGDTLDGGWGNDTVDGGDGTDLVFLGTGNDLFVDNWQGGALGKDTVWAGDGNDTIEGGGGNDLFNGQNGADRLSGGDAHDRLNGGDQNDTLIGGEGNDTVTGGNGADRGYLGAGNDIWIDSDQSRWGNDKVFGGDGDDRIEMRGGDDTATGGAGADSFVFGPEIDADRVTDFAAGTDRLEIDAGLWGGALDQARLDAVSTLASGTLVLDFGAGGAITMEGWTDNAGLLADIVLV